MAVVPFIIIFLVIVPIIIALAYDKKEEPAEKPVVEEQKTVDEIIMLSDYEKLKEKYAYIRNIWVEAIHNNILYSVKIHCLYYAIDCENEFFTFDEIWRDYMEGSGDEEDDTNMKDVLHEALLEIINDGYLKYDNEKHTYTPTFYA